MIRQEIAINGPPSAEAIFDVVPIADARFAEFPAEIHFLIAIERAEVDQTRIDILQLAADLLNLLYGRFESASGGFFALPKLHGLIARRHGAAQHRNTLLDVQKLRIDFFVFLLGSDQGAQQPLQLRQ